MEAAQQTLDKATPELSRIEVNAGASLVMSRVPGKRTRARVVTVQDQLALADRNLAQRQNEFEDLKGNAREMERNLRQCVASRVEIVSL